uniref:Ig-like domain-containing protein n=1 Tax=Chelonoidis abingdonii TaxID=106734 RepID=A0A8C0GVK6_CHEAB
VNLSPVASVFGSVNGNSVTQTEGSVTLCEGEPVLLNCTYQTTGYPTLFWYVQYGSQAPRLFLRESSKRHRRGFSAKLEKRSKSFPLEKNSSKVSNSAAYYCAMRDTASKVTWGAIRVRPIKG